MITSKKTFLTQDQKFEIYGDPLDWSNLVYAKTPYPMVIAWDNKITINRFLCHHKIKGNIEGALQCILDTYGLEEIQRLGLDQFGGCHNDRHMRGSRTKWSSHAWGIAIDILPQKNGLRTKAPKAAFSHPEYAPFLEIMREYTFLNYGVEKGYDWMHFEIMPPIT